MKTKTNMYKHSVKQWNPFVGCRFNCSYCKSSFQRQIKRWAKENCDKCYSFTPHEHPERLTQSLPNTGFMQFIFTCSSGDIAFCPSDYLLKIIARIRNEPHKKFLMQSKAPQILKEFNFPGNIILGTTIETNRDDLYEGISKAPKPSQRYSDFLTVQHPMKMITIEPVIDFNLNVMTNWIESINPIMVWLGYDSRNSHLPEPSLDKVKQLHWELGKKGFTVILKKIRPAWWEKSDLENPADIKTVDNVEKGFCLRDKK